MWARIRSTIRGLFRRDRIEGELGEELQFHLHARADDWQRRGLSPDEAQRRARLEFGGMGAVAERCREARGLRLFNELRADLRFALRLMRRSPMFTAIAVTTLALAIGANTAIFGLVDAALLKPLPFSHPEELRTLAWRAPHFSTWYNGESHEDAAGVEVRSAFSYPAYLALRDRGRLVNSVVAFVGFGEVNFNLGGRAELGAGLLVSGNFFTDLGVRMAIGRALAPDDDRPGAPPVVVLSYGFWQRAFGGEASVVGRTVGVNGATAVVVGVAAQGFCGPRPGRCFDIAGPIESLSLAMYAVPDILTNAKKWGFPVIVRLAPGVTDAQAAAEAEAIVRQVVMANPPDETPYDLPRVSLASGGRGLDDLQRRYSTPLKALLAVVGAVLLIACANITGLLLTQAAARQHELTTRLALGAGRGRLARQLLTEAVLLSTLGGSLGVALALAIRELTPYALAPASRPLHLDVGLDWRMLAFTAGICALAGLLCGLLPALVASRTTVLSGPARGVAEVAGRRRLWTGKALIVVQVALSLILVAAAGLFVRTLVNLRGEALGFKPDYLLLFQMDATLSGYKDARLKDFYEAALARVAATPGVRLASMSRWGLISDSATGDVIATAANGATGAGRDVKVHYVAPDYFRTMGIALVDGRDVAQSDREGAPSVAIVNGALARRSFGSSPIGRRFGFGGPDSVNEIEIVGVAGDARFSTLREPAPPTVYIPFRQHAQHVMTFAVRTDLEPTTLVRPLRETLAGHDANVPISDVRSQQAQIDQSLQQERLFAQLVSGFALLALVLACLGIYGTLAYTVARRTPEIGVRMALGAERRHIVRMVAGDVAAPVVVGLLLGVGGALASTTALATLLYGLTPRDAGTLITAATVLLTSAALAAWLPSRRASRVDPTAALRQE